ncbi:hypothetical protein KCU85_g442, partial [Aureobasidium melanogenum]
MTSSGLSLLPLVTSQSSSSASVVSAIGAVHAPSLARRCWLSNGSHFRLYRKCRCSSSAVVEKVDWDFRTGVVTSSYFGGNAARIQDAHHCRCHYQCDARQGNVSDPMEGERSLLIAATCTVEIHLRASSSCFMVRFLLSALTIAAPPRIVSARGSLSGSSCSAMLKQHDARANCQEAHDHTYYTYRTAAKSSEQDG